LDWTPENQDAHFDRMTIIYNPQVFNPMNQQNIIWNLLPLIFSREFYRALFFLQVLHTYRLQVDYVEYSFFLGNFATIVVERKS
jgi:hypothetical protein